MLEQKTKDELVPLLENLLEELKGKRNIHREQIVDLAVHVVKPLLRDIDGTCLLVKRIDDIELARTFVGVLLENTDVGIQPTTKNFAGVVTVTHGCDTKGRLSGPGKVHMSMCDEMSFEEIVQSLSHFKLNFTLAEEMKRLIIVKKCYDYVRKNSLSEVEDREILEKFAKNKSQRREMIKFLAGESV